MEQPVTYYVVHGYLTPTGEKTFSDQAEAIEEAKKLTQNDWVSQVTVIKHEVIVSWVRPKRVPVSLKLERHESGCEWFAGYHCTCQ